MRNLWVAAMVIFIIVFSGVSIYAAKSVRDGSVSEYMLNHDDGYFLYRSLTKTVLNRLGPGYTKESALTALRDYVYLIAQPADDDLSYTLRNLIVYGIAWCDHSSWMYLTLIAHLKVKGSLTYLFNENGKSPHTVSFISYDSSSAENKGHDVMASSKVVDTYNGITFKTQDNGYASPNQICANEFIPNRGSQLSSLFCNKPRLHRSNEMVISNPKGENYFYRNIFPYLPESFSRYYFHFAFRFVQGREEGERRYLMARVDNLFFRLDYARRGYQEVEKKYPGTLWAKLSRHYREGLGDVAKCFSENGYTGILPETQAWSAVAYPDRPR